MTGVTFGLSMNLHEMTNAEAQFRFADEAGFRMAWFSDTQSLQRELYVQATVGAFFTKRLIINPGPTNPVTRHPAVTASAIATIDEISGGRGALSISTGDSAIYNIGLRPARVDDLREYILTLKALWRDHEATYQGKKIRLLWAKREIPIYLVAEGPRTLRLAGEIADGVVIGLGFTPEAITGALGYLQEGAALAGRSLDDLDIWWQTRWNINDDRQRAIDEIRMGLAAGANHAFRFSIEGKFLPERYHEPIRQLQAAYAFAEHGAVEATHAPLVDQLGLRDYLLERFAIAGTTQDFIRRVGELADLGVRQIRLAMSGRDRARMLRVVADEVMPRVGVKRKT